MQEAYHLPHSHSKSLLFWGGVPWQKFFSPVWTCIKPNLVSKIFPFTGGGGSLNKNFFCQSEHVSSQIWCHKFFPLLGGRSLNKILFASLNMYQAKSGVKIFSLYCDQVPPWTWDWVPPRPGTPLLDLRLGTPPDLDLGPPSTWTWTWDPPKSEQTDISKYKYYLPSYYIRGW